MMTDGWVPSFLELIFGCARRWRVPLIWISRFRNRRLGHLFFHPCPARALVRIPVLGLCTCLLASGGAQVKRRSCGSDGR